MRRGFQGSSKKGLWKTLGAPFLSDCGEKLAFAHRSRSRVSTNSFFQGGELCLSANGTHLKDLINAGSRRLSST